MPHVSTLSFYFTAALILFPALGHGQRRRPVQLALVERRALRAAALGLVLRDDLRRDVNQVLLLVILDKVQALRRQGEVGASF